MTPATLQPPMHTTDPMGGEVLGWGAPIRILADARQISSRRKLAADIPLTDSIWTIKIRYRFGVGPGWRVTVRHAGRVIPLDIIGDPDDLGGKRQWLILTAQTGTGEAMTQLPTPDAPAVPSGSLALTAGWLTPPAGSLAIA